MSVSEQKETCDQKVSCSWIKSLVFGIFGNEYIYIYILNPSVFVDTMRITFAHRRLRCVTQLRDHAV